MIVMIQNSMMMVRNGNWWLVIWLILNVFRLVICLVMMIGMFIVLNVIGVVLMIRYRLVVYSGLKFSLISNVVVIVIGVLKLVVFFRKVLNVKLIISICRCWFLVIDRIEVWMMLNCLVLIEILQRNIVLMMIYVIGYRLQMKLKLVVFSVCGNGMWQNNRVMLSVMVMVIVLVSQFFMCSMVRVMKKNVIGSSVIRLDNYRLLVGLYRCCQGCMKIFDWGWVYYCRGGWLLVLLLLVILIMNCEVIGCRLN